MKKSCVPLRINCEELDIIYESDELEYIEEAKQNYEDDNVTEDIILKPSSLFNSKPDTPKKSYCYLLCFKFWKRFF